MQSAIRCCSAPVPPSQVSPPSGIVQEARLSLLGLTTGLVGRWFGWQFGCRAIALAVA